MNYITEMNAFYDWLETNTISSSAIVLWHALMAINNKCGWIPEFAVATSVLEVKTGLKRRAIERARNELEQKGRITWKSRKGNQSALYHIVRFKDAQSVAQYDAQVDVQPVAQSDAINKLNNTKLNKNNLPEQQARAREDDKNPFAVYEREIGRMTPIIRDSMIDWLDAGYFDEPEGLLLAAIREAVVNEKRSWAYIDRILRRCLEENIKTVSQMEQKKLEHEAAKNPKVTPIHRKREERNQGVPQHILDQLKEQEKECKPEGPSSKTMDLDIDREIDEMLTALNQAKTIREGAR